MTKEIGGLRVEYYRRPYVIDVTEGDVGVKVTDVATGRCAHSCQYRSRHKNKAEAMRLLRADGLPALGGVSRSTPPRPKQTILEQLEALQPKTVAEGSAEKCTGEPSSILNCKPSPVHASAVRLPVLWCADLTSDVSYFEIGSVTVDVSVPADADVISRDIITNLHEHIRAVLPPGQVSLIFGEPGQWVRIRDRKESE